jgi:hypothetical protein
MILKRLGRGARGPQKPEKTAKPEKLEKSPKEAQMAPKTTTTAAPAPQRAAKPPVEDDVSAKEAFADDFVGLYSIGPNFHFTFATRRPGKSGSMSRLVTARVVLPLDAVLEMYNSLQAAVKQLETSGVVKRRGPGGNA